MFIDDDDRPAPLERLLLTMVRAIRADTSSAPRGRPQVHRAARRRRRRGTVASSLTGPFASIALPLAVLYGEARTLSDLEATHALGMSDELFAAHLLVMWSVTDDLELARAAIDATREPSLARLLSDNLQVAGAAAIPTLASKRALVSALWRVRGRAWNVTGRRRARQLLGGALRPGRETKRFIHRAELQLGVR